MMFSWKGFLFLTILVISNQIALAGAQTLPSPLEQVRSGVAPQDVKCGQGLELVINKFSEEPACVGLSHIARLLAIGWTTPDTYAALHPPINQAKTLIPQKVLEDNGTGNKTNADITKTTLNSNAPNNSASRFGSIKLPKGISTPLISSSNPPYLKLLSIGMYPNPPKVGDWFGFNATFQNISNKSFYISHGCRATTLFSTIMPISSVQEYPAYNKIMCADYQKEIKPNETFTTGAHSLPHNGAYKIIRSGLLNVTLTQVTTDHKTGWKVAETVNFNVNATQ